MTRVIIVLIRIYQFAVSPWLRGCCRFETSCSHYALGAVQRFGAARGLRLIAGRLLRCHPWGGPDPEWN